MGLAELKNQTPNPIKVTMTKMNSVSSAAVVIRSWNVQFHSVHNVQTIKIGSWGYPSIAGTDVTIPNLYADMNDCSGNKQDDSSSYCDVLVIAAP
jgi:hypothetical protein